MKDIVKKYFFLLNLIIVPVVLFIGCLSPEKAIRQADEVASDLASSYIRDLTGRTNTFTIALPSERLRDKLLAEQGLAPDIKRMLTPSASTNRTVATLPDPFLITLSDAMIIGAVNDSRYQIEKEKVFLQALALDESRHEFDTTFAGLLGLGVSGAEGDDDDASVRSLTGDSEAKLSKKFRNGISFVSSIGLDIVRLLTGERTTTLGLTGEASLSVPLLRGFGTAVAAEALTQAERDMIYAVYTFEKYRMSYTVSIAKEYYSLLEQQQNYQAIIDNLSRLQENFDRSKMLYDAGRLSQVELDQTRQKLLANQDSAYSAEQNLSSSLDAFKISLGLPVEARITLDASELTRVQEDMMSRVTETNSVGQPLQPALPWTTDSAIELALTNRIDNILALYKLEDARRHFTLAKDELLSELALKLSAAHGRDKVTGGDWSDETIYGASLELDPILDGTKKRNNYRRAAIALESNERDYITLVDETRKLIRDDFRTLDAAWSSYVIQREALQVAESRVESTTIFQQAGKSSTRDVLEAQDALVKAQNALVSALVKYRMAGLQLRRDLSVLKVTDEGLLLE